MFALIRSRYETFSVCLSVFLSFFLSIFFLSPSQFFFCSIFLCHPSPALSSECLRIYLLYHSAFPLSFSHFICINYSLKYIFPSSTLFLRQIHLPHSMSCALLTRLVTTSISCRGSGVVANGCISIIFIHSSKVSSCKLTLQ